MPSAFWIGGSRPLLMATYWANYSLSGPSTFAYHAVNIFLHTVAAALAFGVLRKLLQLAYPSVNPNLPSSFGAMVFLVHPLQTESVDYLAGRSEVLCVLFVLASWLIFLGHFNERTTVVTAAKVLACAGAAVLSKESGVCLAALLVATDLFWKTGSVAEQLRKRWALYGPAVVCTLAAAFVILRSLSHSTTAGFSSGSTPAHYALTESEAILLYLRLFLFPVGQNVDWQLPVIGTWVQAWPYVAGLGMMMIAIVVLYRRARLISFGLLVFLIALAPTSSIIPIADPMAERRMYLPVLGLIIALLGAAFEISRLRPVLTPAAAAIAAMAVAMLGIASWHRSGLWSSDVTLWRDAIASNPRNSRAHSNLGGAFLIRQDCSEAVREYEVAVGIGGLDEVNGDNLGRAYECSHQPDKALATYRKLVALHPIAYDWARIGYFEGVQQHPDAAIDAFTTAIRLDPGNVTAYTFRGIARVTLNDLTAGREDLRRALALDPTNAAALQWMAKLPKEP